VAVSTGILAFTVLAVVVPYAFVLAAVGIPHGAVADAVCTLELAFVRVSIIEYPYALLEAPVPEVPIIYLTSMACVYANSMAHVVVPGSVIDCARAI